jgi:hypothetical protein
MKSYVFNKVMKMLVAVRFSDGMLQKYIEEGMVKEIGEYEEKLATLKMYESNSHYFFSVTPKEIFFIRNKNCTVVMRKEGYLTDLSAIAYKMFLLSLIKDRLEGGIARKTRIVWMDGIENKIQKEIFSLNRFRTMGPSMYYPEEDYYEFSIRY